jgi:hypothetical protein
MNRIETLAKKFEDHISLQWQQNLSSPEKTIFIVYPKDDELRLRAKKDLFRQACVKAAHPWQEIDLDGAFPDWMASQDYAEDYFEFPQDLKQKLEIEFTGHVAGLIRARLESMGEDEALGVLGVGSVFGFTHFSSVLRQLEGCVRGRLVVLFPGSHDKGNVYHLLDARDSWDYMAYPITLTEVAYL